MIRHSASSVNRSSTPLEILKMAHVQGGWLLLFTVLAEWRIMANRAYAKNNEDGLLCSILWSYSVVEFCDEWNNLWHPAWRQQNFLQTMKSFCKFFSFLAVLKIKFMCGYIEKLSEFNVVSFFIMFVIRVRSILRFSEVVYSSVEMLLPTLRRISSPRTNLLAAHCECMHEHFHPITMLNS
jgi:hypothetical protein